MDCIRMVMDCPSMVEATGCYQFKIDHSKTKDMGIGEMICSPTFRVGPFDWGIQYFPRGCLKDHDGKYVTVALFKQTDSINVKAEFEFSLLDMHGNSSLTTRSTQTFTSDEVCWAIPDFFEKSKLEEECVKDCYITLLVKVTVKDESLTGVFWRTNSLEIPRMRLQQLREENKSTDISFNVGGKIFHAHKVILAAHSTVFEAEFLGAMGEPSRECIDVNDMIPAVFEVLLYFVYNGSFPHRTVDSEGPISQTTFLQNLLVAADIYKIDKLKPKCVHEISTTISLDTVLSTLELAHKNNYTDLMEDCAKFIGRHSQLFVVNEAYCRLMIKYPSLLNDLKAKMNVRSSGI